MTHLLMADIPNGAVLTPVILDAFKTFGIDVVTVGCQDPPPPYAASTAEANFATLDAYGWAKRRTGAYFEDQDPAKVATDWTGSNARIAQCGLVAGAVEESGGFYSQDQIDGLFSEIDAIIGAGRGVLYGSSYEQNAVGNAALSYPTRRGWCANYTLTADAAPVEFFGVAEVIAVQFNGAADITGVPFKVDISWVDDSALEGDGGTPIAQGGDMIQASQVTKLTDPGVYVPTAKHIGDQFSQALAEQNGDFIATLAFGTVDPDLVPAGKVAYLVVIDA